MAPLPRRRGSVLLELDLTEPPVEGDLGAVGRLLRPRGRHRFGPTIRALYEGAADRHVVGLIAKVGRRLPWAVMQELRLGVLEFAESGKPTVAWAETFGEESGDMTAYVLATAFNEIWLQPGGGLGLLGVGVETTFVKGALDHLGVEPQLLQRYEFKNAADVLMRSEYSDAHHAALDGLVESIFTDAVVTVAEGRNMDAGRVRELVETGPRTAAKAQQDGLVDGLGYRDQAYAAIRARVSTDAALLFADQWHPPSRPHPLARRKGHVASVEVRGTIVSGRSHRSPAGRQVGSDTVTAALRAVGRDDRAKAVVLRIDSPGGSAVASETIWREVCRLRDAGKPVVVSMGEKAASGGYYIACPADVIVALPATLTGSIGVFGGKLVVRQLLDRLGLTTGTVSRGARSLMYSTRQGFTGDERERLAMALDQIYDDFVAKVATGRGRPVVEIAAIARGRVWTGSDAVRLGLADEIGGMRDAVRIARKRAGLPGSAPVRPARNLSWLARLGGPKNSDDRRAGAAAALPGIADLTAVPEFRSATTLRMPSITLR